MPMLILAIVLALLVIGVVFLIAGLIVRAARRDAAREGNWDTRALEACAAADALHDQLSARLMVLQRAAGGDGDTPAARWSDTERSLDQLAVKLHALHFSAPSYTTDQATERLIMALSALRSALQLEHGARAVSGALATEPVSTAQARLMELDAAVRALRAAV